MAKQKELEQDDIKLRIELAKLQRSTGPRYFTADEERELASALAKHGLQSANIVCVI